MCAAGTGKGETEQGCNEAKSFTRDEGRSFEIGFQEQVSNHLKQLLLRVMVVSVEEKLRNTWQVWVRKTNIPEPL